MIVSLTRRIVITGASSGLGAGLALDYAAPGISLVLLARRIDMLQRVAADCRERGAVVELFALDVGDAEPIGSLLRAMDEQDAFDLVIANAGIAGPPGEANAAAQIRTNLLGVIHTIESLIPRMVARGRGQIAVVSSVAAFRGLPDSPAYCGSKAGVRAYGEALRAGLRQAGIDVSVVVPGFFGSPMSDRFAGRKLLMVSGARAVRIVRRGLDRRRGRIGFPGALIGLMRLLDMLPPALGDRLIRLFRFQIFSAGAAGNPQPDGNTRRGSCRRTG
jgi:short-subunit dehydrogenase